MPTPQYSTRRSLSQRTVFARRSGFTLTEMLMVIAIIGILAGLLTPALMRVLGDANAFTITNEIQQMDAAIENFESEHGFYPPTIGASSEVNSVGVMRRYLNRIAPNHSEGNGIDGGGLNRWWVAVGQNMDARSSLVFWLSGLCKNKQFPLSGGVATALAPYDANVLIDGTPVGVPIERDVRFDFRQERLAAIAAIAEVKGYNQAAGRDNGDSFYRYRDNKSYARPDGSGGVVAQAYHSGFNGMVPINFQNANTFQIIAPGMDGDFSIAPGVTQTFNIQAVDSGQLDNLTNFTDGPLEKLID